MNKGFTLVELIMVIVIIGLLAIVALPRYFNLREQAQEAATSGVVSAVRTGISLYRSDMMVSNPDADPAALYPDNLCGATAADRVDLFGKVLDPAVQANGWKATGEHGYTAPDGSTWTYTSATGTFAN